jgi:ATP-dependent Clp protease ATP-binding subunit ClpA
LFAVKNMCLIMFFFGFSGHNYVGSEHLLLGLLREGEGVAARVLESLGADPNNIRTQAILFY